MTLLRAATRGSKLALIQTQRVIDALQKVCPGLSVEMQILRTQGDQQADAPLWKLEGSGFFTARLQQALLEGAADFAVHSFKDLPTQTPDGLCIAAVLERDFPEDVLLARRPIRNLQELPPSACVGTSSIRRQAQLLRRRPDVRVEPLRGNVETRLRKLQEGRYDAVILARAGLERLGIHGWNGLILDPLDFLPAPAQGVIAVEILRENERLFELFQTIHHVPTAAAAQAERRILARLHPGCHAPVGAYAAIENEQITLTAFASGPQGHPFLKERICGPVRNAVEWADCLAERLIEQGALEILKTNA
ncbi:MAG TPA: hydroxymethylbilane synthase [Anaerohalosphaeraceae bacterium]|nr:hydroxymethylbilane synthase [Anaerohalosphaeraceae bacterium]